MGRSYHLYFQVKERDIIDLNPVLNPTGEGCEIDDIVTVLQSLYYSSFTKRFAMGNVAYREQDLLTPICQYYKHCGPEDLFSTETFKNYGVIMDEK